MGICYGRRFGIVDGTDIGGLLGTIIVLYYIRYVAGSRVEGSATKEKPSM